MTHGKLPGISRDPSQPRVPVSGCGDGEGLFEGLVNHQI